MPQNQIGSSSTRSEPSASKRAGHAELNMARLSAGEPKAGDYVPPVPSFRHAAKSDRKQLNPIGAERVKASGPRRAEYGAAFSGRAESRGLRAARAVVQTCRKI